MAALVVAGFGLSASGCMTVYVQHAYWTGDPDAESLLCGPVYAGTIGDVLSVCGAVHLAEEASWPWRVLFAVDLPLSIAADTALLPLALGERIEIALRDE
jgi:uncharacterized protein YceK